MAAELTLVVSFSCVKDGATTADKATSSIDVSSSLQNSAVQNIGTSWVAVNLGGVTSLGYFYYKNLDVTNYIEFSADSGGANPLVKALAGDFGSFRLTSAALYARAHTAACNLKYILLSN